MRKLACLMTVLAIGVLYTTFAQAGFRGGFGGSAIAFRGGGGFGGAAIINNQALVAGGFRRGQIAAINTFGAFPAVSAANIRFGRASFVSVRAPLITAAPILEQRVRYFPGQALIVGDRGGAAYIRRSAAVVVDPGYSSGGYTSGDVNYITRRSAVVVADPGYSSGGYTSGDVNYITAPSAYSYSGDPSAVVARQTYAYSTGPSYVTSSGPSYVTSGGGAAYITSSSAVTSDPGISYITSSGPQFIAAGTRYFATAGNYCPAPIIGRPVQPIVRPGFPIATPYGVAAISTGRGFRGFGGFGGFRGFGGGFRRR